MARTQSPALEVVEGGEAPAKQSKPKDTVTVATNVPLTLKEMVDKAAEDAKISVALWTKQLIAKQFNYELPVETRKTRTPGKYAGMTDEQKAEAIAKEQTAKKQKSAALLAALEAGDLDIDLEAILAKHGGAYKPRGPRAAKTEDTESAPNTESVPATSE